MSPKALTGHIVRRQWWVGGRQVGRPTTLVGGGGQGLEVGAPPPRVDRARGVLGPGHVPPHTTTRAWHAARVASLFLAGHRLYHGDLSPDEAGLRAGPRGPTAVTALLAGDV